jgi:phage shock protein A
MGVLDRLTTLVRANLNDLLDSAEDPEVMLNQILRDMEEEMGRARSQVAAMLAQQKELEADRAAEQAQAEAWEERAELAARHGQDALARQALSRMNDAQAHVALYGQQVETQQALVRRLRDQLDALDRKYQQAQGNRDALLARHRRAQAQDQVTQAGQAARPDYGSDLARMERRIRGEEARAAANAELADDGDPDLTADLDQHALDDQLTALKSRLGLAESDDAPGGSATQRM